MHCRKYGNCKKNHIFCELSNYFNARKFINQCEHKKLQTKMGMEEAKLFK